MGGRMIWSFAHLLHHYVANYCIRDLYISSLSSIYWSTNGDGEVAAASVGRGECRSSLLRSRLIQIDIIYKRGKIFLHKTNIWWELDRCKSFFRPNFVVSQRKNITHSGNYAAAGGSGAADHDTALIPPLFNSRLISFFKQSIWVKQIFSPSLFLFSS